MFKLVAVERGSRESVWFVSRLDMGRGFFRDAAIFGELCIIHDIYETRVYMLGGRCYYHLTCFYEQVIH